MKTKFILQLFLGLLFSTVLAVTFAPLVGVGTLTVFCIIVVLAAIPKSVPGMLAALDVELWKPWIVEQLFKNNDFLNLARNADEYVLVGKVVHIPQAGSASGVKKNRLSLPATVKKRTDTDVTYALDEFTSDPRLLTDVENILSYDKMASCMGQDMGAIRQLVAEEMLYAWAFKDHDDFIVRTTGGVVTAHLPGATGNRKLLTLADLAEAQARMDEQLVDPENRYGMLSARMYQQLTALMTATQYRDFSASYDATKGIVGDLYGFKFLKRATVLKATNAATPVVKALDAVNATTDNDVILCWQQDCVERAVGEVKIFENKQDATYYGDIYSLLARAGGRKVREDNKGVIGIVQGV